MNDLRDNYITNTSHDEIRRVLERLSWWSDRCAGHVSERRAIERYECSIPLRLCVPILPGELRPHLPSEIVFECFSRNFSSTGASFIVPLQIDPVCLFDHSSSINTEQVLPIGHKIRVEFSCSEGQMIWMHTEVIRTKRVDASLLEVGVRFLRRDDLPKRKLCECQSEPASHDRDAHHVS